MTGGSRSHKKMVFWDRLVRFYAPFYLKPLDLPGHLVMMGNPPSSPPPTENRCLSFLFQNGSQRPLRITACDKCTSQSQRSLHRGPKTEVTVVQSRQRRPCQGRFAHGHLSSAIAVLLASWPVSPSHPETACRISATLTARVYQQIQSMRMEEPDCFFLSHVGWPMVFMIHQPETRCCGSFGYRG